MKSPFQFDLQLFSQAPSSELITVGLGKETGGYGVAATPTAFLIPSSLPMDGTNDLLARTGAKKRIGQSEQPTGMFTGKGTMQVEADCDSFGAILLPTMGAEAIAVSANNPLAVTVATTLPNGVGQGFQMATPGAMTGITKGQSLTIDTAGNIETVVVRAVNTTSFWAYFTKAHAAAAPVANAGVVQAYNHTFTLASPRPSFTLQLNDILTAKNAFGAKVSQLDFNLSPKQIVEAQVQVEYQGEAQVGAPVSPSYSVLQGMVFETPGNAITLNGAAADSSVQGIKLSINTGLITDYPKFGNGRYRGQLPEGQTKVKGSIDFAFESTSVLQMFWGQIGATGPQGDVLPVPIVITVATVDPINTAINYGLQIIIPKAKFTTAPVVRKTPDYLKQTVSFETSESINGAGDDVSFILTNANSAASL